VRLAASRLLIGLIVLICAEVFSGASIQVGMWAPWTWLMTYWLYFAHFFVLCTLAAWTGRTSLGALYLWGVLFGPYESWITKVIWFGYGGDGYRPRTPLAAAPEVTDDERRRLVGGLTPMFTLGFAASFVAGAPALMLPIVVNFAIWTPLGLVLTSLALTGPIFSRRRS
jgi:hypothetical protein